MAELDSVSPIDGRYKLRLSCISDYFSERALMKKRVFVELKYLVALKKADASIMKICDDFDSVEAEKVKALEKTTNHDVKAVEYYLRGKVPPGLREQIHYGLTSDDVNNISYSLLIKDFLDNMLYARLSDLLKVLERLSYENKKVAMLARTHGQPASPTTMGKEFLVFYYRLKIQYTKLQGFTLTAKLNGATGNYNAISFAEPGKDWISFSREFITDLGLLPNLVTTQIEPKDSLVELFQIIKRINNILLGLDRDMWLYIMQDYLLLKKKEGEVGSSTMPHKVNPIDFENSEGNLKIANSLLTGFEDLQISRLQRDLSDSTVMRNIGVAFSHCLLGYGSTEAGLGKITPNLAKINQDLDEHPEVITEAIQTILRKSSVPDSYDRLKRIYRGNKTSQEDLQKFIAGLDIDKNDKKRLKSLTGRLYTGLASDIVDKFLQ